MSDTFNLDSLANMSDDDFIGKSYVSPEQEEVDIPDSNNEEVPNNENELETEEVLDGETQDETAEEDEQTESEELDENSSDDEEDQQTDEVSELNQNADELLSKLFSPFNANGTQIKVDTVEEAIELMQMGANYHKKMNLLKPHLRFIKALETKGLLDEDKVNFAIDLLNNDKKAITKLIADGNIDPLDLNTDESGEYAPSKHVESEQSHNLNEVLSEVQTLPDFKATMDVVTHQWDSSSKDALVAHPERIKLLVAHKANGTFDRINAEVARMRMFNQLPSTLSDMDAYEKVGMMLMQQSQQAPTKVQAPENKPQNTEQKKRIAQPKAKSPAKQSNSIDSLSELSDEEFQKISHKYF